MGMTWGRLEHCEVVLVALVATQAFMTPLQQAALKLVPATWHCLLALSTNGQTKRRIKQGILCSRSPEKI